MNAETSWKKPNNIKTTTNWTSIVKMAVKTIIGKTDFTGLKKISFVHTVLSTLWNSKPPAYSVTFGKAEGYFKTQVSGTLYTRSIIIEDKLNRVKGHAYYPWGYSERLSATQKYNIKYPVRQRTSTTYDYGSIAKAGTPSVMANDSFYGEVSSLRAIIDIYARGASANAFVEKVDVYGAVHDLLNP